MKSYLVIFFFILSLSASAQKVTQDVLASAHLDKIVLSSDEIYRINIKASTTEEIQIKTKTEGEYFNQISLDTKLEGSTLLLSSRYREILQSGYDKLSAHKVFSMEVDLEIPEGMVLQINSNTASVYLSGRYKSVFIELKNGSCYLSDFSGEAVINTYDGNILGTVSKVNVEAKTRHGTMNLPQVPGGIHNMVLTSINGDIKLTETK
jgi:DUF4097 and DUF4098 domain-containing protein YvlB